MIIYYCDKCPHRDTCEADEYKKQGWCYTLPRRTGGKGAEKEEKMGYYEDAQKPFEEATIAQAVAAVLTRDWEVGSGADRAHSPNPKYHHGGNRPIKPPSGASRALMELAEEIARFPTLYGWAIRWGEERGSAGADAQGNWHTWRRSVAILRAPSGTVYRF